MCFQHLFNCHLLMISLAFYSPRLYLFLPTPHLTLNPALIGFSYLTNCQGINYLITKYIMLPFNQSFESSLIES